MVGRGPAAPRPSRRAKRFPTLPPVASAAPSSTTSRPIERRRAATSSAIARSFPNGLEMRHSASNVSLRRAFSASPAGLTIACRRPAEPPRVAAAASRLPLEPPRGLSDRGGGAGWGAGRIRGRKGLLRPALLGARQGGADELAEQRRRAVRPRLELRVVLGCHEERMVVDLDDLHQSLVRRGA